MIVWRTIQTKHWPSKTKERKKPTFVGIKYSTGSMWLSLLLFCSFFFWFIYLLFFYFEKKNLKASLFERIWSLDNKGDFPLFCLSILSLLVPFSFQVFFLSTLSVNFLVWDFIILSCNSSILCFSYKVNKNKNSFLGE